MLLTIKCSSELIVQVQLKPTRNVVQPKKLRVMLPLRLPLKSSEYKDKCEPSCCEAK